MSPKLPFYLDRPTTLSLIAESQRRISERRAIKTRDRATQNLLDDAERKASRARFTGDAVIDLTTPKKS